jgi:hypothetical protein
LYWFFIYGAGEVLPGASFEELFFWFVLFVGIVISLIGFTILIMLIPGGLGIISKSRKWLFIKWGVSELFFQELFEILFGACDWSIFELDSLFQVGI